MPEELDNQAEYSSEPQSGQEAEQIAGGEEEEQYQPAKAVSARKPGWLSRMGNNIGQQVARIDLPPWNFRNFLYGLAVLIILILFFRNWVDVRLDFIIWRFDIPKSIVVVVPLLLGAGLLRAWQLYRQRQSAATQQSPEE